MTRKNCDGIETEERKSQECENLDINGEQTMLERHIDDRLLIA